MATPERMEGGALASGQRRTMRRLVLWICVLGLAAPVPGIASESAEPRCPGAMSALFFGPIGPQWDHGRLRSFHSGDAITLYHGHGYPRYRMSISGECTEIPSAALPSSNFGFYGRAKAARVRRVAKQGAARDGVFLGDSILNQSRGAPYRETIRLWDDIQGGDAFLNVGIPGASTSQILGMVDLIDATSRLVAIQIGTNNHHTGRFNPNPAETAEGIARIVAEARARAPGTRVLLVAIPPTEGPRRQQRNRRTNELIETLADGKHVFFLDPGPLLDPGDPGISSDGIHLRPHGQHLWYGAITPTLRALLEGREPPPPDLLLANRLLR